MGTERALVVFGSTTGTTQHLASAVRKGLEAAGLAVDVRNAANTRARHLAGYSIVLAGCSTWEDGCLQRDFRKFLAELGDLRMDGVLAAVFGAGSRSYPLFCHAVDLVERDLIMRGARLILPGFRLDGAPYAARPVVRSWAEGIRDFL